MHGWSRHHLRPRILPPFLIPASGQQLPLRLADDDPGVTGSPPPDLASELSLLGADVMSGLGAPDPYSFVLTRLHARDGAETLLAIDDIPALPGEPMQVNPYPQSLAAGAVVEPLPAEPPPAEMPPVEPPATQPPPLPEPALNGPAHKRSLPGEGGARHGNLCTGPRRDERPYGIGGESYGGRARAGRGVTDGR